jgi:ketopantoate reductase
MTEPKILFIGPGAIGGSVAAWVAENYPATFVMGHGATLPALRQNGLTTYRFDAPDATRRTVRPTIVDRPGAVADAAIVVLTVKNYSLEAVARQVKDELGDRPIVVSIANGIDNQRILPKLFSKVVYGIASYNARREAPGVIGYQHKLPLLIGGIDNTLGAELALVQSVLGRGCPVEIAARMQDAIHTKIVVNLTNALDALVGRGAQTAVEPGDFSAAVDADAVGGRAHHSRRRPSRISRARYAVICIPASCRRAARLAHPPVVPPPAARHADVEHDAGRHAARRGSHRA